MSTMCGMVRFHLLEPSPPPKLDERGNSSAAISARMVTRGPGAASIAGVAGVPAVDDAVRKFNYDYGLRLARMGYVTVCPRCAWLGIPS